MMKDSFIQDLGIQVMSPEEKKAWNKKHIGLEKYFHPQHSDNETTWTVCDYSRITSADIAERIVVYLKLEEILENTQFKRMGISGYIQFGRDEILMNADIALPRGLEGSFLPDCAKALYYLLETTTSEYLQGKKLVRWVKDYACYFPQIIERSISKYIISTGASLISNIIVCTLIESADESKQESVEY